MKNTIDQQKNKYEITAVEKGLYVPFHVIFDRIDDENLKLFNFLPLNRRIQLNQLDLITEDYNIIMKDDVILHYKLLDLIFYIKVENPGMSSDEFISTVKIFLESNPKITDTISNEIENNYTLNLNAVKGNANKVNAEIQVTDETNKVFLKGTMLMRFVTPIICIYENTLDGEYNTFDIYCECLKWFSDTEDENAIINKLHKLVFSRFIKTKYPHRVIWNYIKQKADDPYIAAMAVTKNIVNTVLLKTRNNTSIVSFLDVVIRRKIKFLFEFNYAISYKSIKVNSSKELEEKEKIEIYHLRQDEGRSKLNELAIKRLCKNIMKKYDITDEELDAEDIPEFNSIQMFILEQFYHEYKIKAIPPKQKYLLLLNLSDKLKENDIYWMDLMLFSYLDTTAQKIGTRKRYINKIIDNPKYDDCIGQYGYIMNLFESNNMIRSLIDLRCNTFIGEDGEILDIPLAPFILECIKFVNII